METTGFLFWESLNNYLLFWFYFLRDLGCDRGHPVLDMVDARGEFAVANFFWRGAPSDNKPDSGFVGELAFDDTRASRGSS